MKKILTTSILALAGVAFMAPAAKAGLSYNFAADSTNADLVVGFSTGATTPHSGNTYMVDFGSVSQLAPLSDGAIHTISLDNGAAGSTVADLGTAGITTASGTFSIYGADPSGLSNVVFMSRHETTPGTTSAHWQNGPTAIANGDILTMLTQNPGGDTASSNPNSLIQSTGSTNSYGSYVFGSNSPTQAFQYFGNPEGALNGGVLDLYRVTDNPNTGPGTLLGAFEYSNGNLLFSSNPADFAPVPEPATFVFGFAMLGACALARSRRQTKAELAA